MEKLYLVPGKSITKKGLPDGKIECKKGSEALVVEEKLLEVIKKNVPFFRSAGTLLNESELEKFLSKAEESGKSEKRIALEAEATELEIEFKNRTSNKDLESMIEEKKAELEEDSE